MKKNFKIVVIEDDDIHRTVVESILLDEGYEVTTATNGQEGLDIVFQDIPDLVITDIRMPIKDGFDVCREIRDNPKTTYIPVVILTANQSTENLTYGFQQGAIDYVLKPFENDELMARVNSAIRFKELREKLAEEKQKTVLFELAGAAAHELNQPLTVLKTTSYLLKDKLNVGNQDENVTKYLQNIDKSVNKMSRIIKKMNKMHEYETKNYALGTKIINLTDSEEKE